LARPPDCDGLAAEIRESNKVSKLVFADWTSEAKNFCSACDSDKNSVIQLEKKN
jgi:hypothetical protein